MDINDIATNTALMAKSSFWQNLGKMDNIAGNKGIGGGTANKVAEIAESVGLSDEETAEVQLALTGANNNLGLDNAIANGDGELAGSITTGIVGATLSDMGEYGKAAMALWQDIPEYDQWFTEQFGDNPEMRQLMLSRIGEYGAHGKSTNDNDVSKFDVTEAANAIFNPKKGWPGRESKEQKEIASLKEAYKSGNADEFERILDSVLTRVLGKIVIQTQ